MEHGPVNSAQTSLDDVLITDELAQRPARTPNYEAENLALTALAEAMAESPQTILKTLVETAVELCRADSAGISILEPGGASGVFRVHAMAGLFSTTGRLLPREGSPSGIVLARDASLLFSHPERYFDYGAAIDPPIVEALLVPYHSDGKPVGTLWVIGHTPSRKFDSEDQRVLTSLSRFASLAHQAKTAAVTSARAIKEARQILDTAAIGLTRCSRDLRYLSCNPAYEKLVGLTADQIIGRRIVDVIGSDAFEVKRPFIERVLHGERVEYEDDVSFAAGGPRCMHVVYTPWFEGEGVVGWMATLSDITDLKRTTETLREREQRLRLALDASGAASWMRDLRTDRIYWDERFRKLYGLTATEPASFELFLNRVHVEDRRQVLALLGQFEETKSRDTFDITFRIARPDGTVAWIESLGQADRDAEGHVIRLTGLELDVTERRLAEDALREREGREEFLLRLADAIRPLSDPIAVQEVTARLLGEHLRVNRVTYADIEGSEFITRQSYVNGVAPVADRGSLAPFEGYLFESQRIGQSIVVDDIRNDSRFGAEERAHTLATGIVAFASVMIVKEGQWVAAFSVSTASPRTWTKTEVDLIGEVAQRMWEAVERASAEADLRERERRLSLALDASAAAVWMWDCATNECSWDERFHRQYGLGPEDPQTFDTWIARVHEDDRPKVLSLLDSALNGRDNEWDVVYRAVRPDGTVVWIQDLGRVDRGRDGQVARISGISLDITERRRAAEALQSRRDEERDRELRGQSEAALRRSHAELERRTLQLSRLASQLTLAEQSARQQIARTLHDGLQQLLFSAGINLDQALASSVQADQALLQRARADVKEATEAARTLSVNLFPPVLHVGGLPAALSWLARRTEEQYNVAVSVTADPKANPPASEIRVLLFEAVRELLFNAVKHAHVERIDVTLGLGPGDTIQIQVRDEGVGFDPNALVDHKHHLQIGLGLFSIQERLALLGGHLDIDSAPGKGSLFRLTLPRTGPPRRDDGNADAHRADMRDSDQPERSVHDSGRDTSSALCIVIADDYAVARAGLRELFSKRPSLRVVGEATNGVEAIAQAVTLRPDVIVMDVSMPGMDGIEATREIHRTLSHIRMVGLSTYDDENIERSMREAGAEAFFTKNEGTDRLLDYLGCLSQQTKGTLRT